MSRSLVFVLLSGLACASCSNDSDKRELASNKPNNDSGDSGSVAAYVAPPPPKSLNASASTSIPSPSASVVRTSTIGATPGSIPAASPPPAEWVSVEPDATIPLPEEASDVVVGGNGRYLLIFLKELQKVGVFDIREATSPKFVNINSTRIFIAAGATRFVVVDPLKFTLTKWRYDDLKQPEATGSFDMAGRRSLLGAVMGLNSEGPLALLFHYEKYNEKRPFVEMIDLGTLQAKNYTIDSRRGNSSLSNPTVVEFDLSATPDGSTILLVAQARCEKITIDDKVLVVHPYRSIARATSANDPDRAFFDGDSFFRRGEVRLFDGDATKLEHGVIVSPALPAQFWLTRKDNHSNWSGTLVSFRIGSESTPIATLLLPKPQGAYGYLRPQQMPPYKRLFYNADEKTLVMLPDYRNEIVVKRFDISTAIENHKESLVHVTSKPPAEFVTGKKYEYPIQAVSNRGGLTYRLESGPEGMTISSDGVVEWTPNGSSASSQSALISVTDKSGKQLFHKLLLKRSELPFVEVTADEQSSADPTTPRVAVCLPTAADDFVVGAAGRYVLAPMNSIRQIAVIDVKERKIAKLLPTDDDVKVAAGATRFVVYSAKGTISRWNFSRLEREISAPYPTPIQALCMGCASEGPILVSPLISQNGLDGTAAFLDLNTLKPSKITISTAKKVLIPRIFANVAASANGQTFTNWRQGSSGFCKYVVRGSEATVYFDYASYGPYLPNADGTIIYTTNGAYSSDGRPLEGQVPSTTKAAMSPITMPAATGVFCLSWTTASKHGGEVEEAHLKCQGVQGFGLTIPEITLPKPTQNVSGGDLFSCRLLYVPIADAIIATGKTMDRLLIYRFELSAALAASNNNYLFVSSTPPIIARPGSRFTYKIEGESRSGGIKFHLASAPQGAQLSAAGVLTWNIGPTVTGPQDFVVLLSDNSGKETEYKFFVDVGK